MGKRKKGNGKYHEWITEEGLLKIEGWARDGLTDENIAHNIGIAVSTLNNWKNRYVELMESLKEGKEVADRKVENALYKRALGYEYEEVKMVVEKDEKGNEKKRQEKVIKKVVPDVTAQIFWLKNRKPEQWRDRHNIDHAGTLEVKSDEAEKYEELIKEDEEARELLKELFRKTD